MLPTADLVCFSHLRWDFVYQRPQHVMSRFARTRRVTFVEEPIHEGTRPAHLRVSSRPGGVQVVVPVLPLGIDGLDAIEAQRELFATELRSSMSSPATLWFQTPTALPLVRIGESDTVVYDCMDELSGFDDAPASLLFDERLLFARADLVFTGGVALYEAKRLRRRDVHCFPSGIDVEHFARARDDRRGPDGRHDGLPPAGPRVGWSGVIDERMDTALLDAVAEILPDHHFVMAGPIVKIDATRLPRRANIHYLGMQRYDDLPQIMGGWDVAIMPFAHNAATRFISPTKTPEYLAAGLPVVSTSVRDVVRQYGDPGLVRIADDPADFAAAIEAALRDDDSPAHRRAVDEALADRSWESIHQRMSALVDIAAEARARRRMPTRRTADAH